MTDLRFISLVLLLAAAAEQKLLQPCVRVKNEAARKSIEERLGLRRFNAERRDPHHHAVGNVAGDICADHREALLGPTARKGIAEPRKLLDQIGRASCRESVCQYV